MRHLKLPELSFTQKAIVIVLILGTLYTGAFIYEQYRLTIEHRDSIKKWCISTGYEQSFYFSGNRAERTNKCIKYFGK